MGGGNFTNTPVSSSDPTALPVLLVQTYLKFGKGRPYRFRPEILVNPKRKLGRLFFFSHFITFACK